MNKNLHATLIKICMAISNVAFLSHRHHQLDNQRPSDFYSVSYSDVQDTETGLQGLSHRKLIDGNKSKIIIIIIIIIMNQIHYCSVKNSSLHLVYTKGKFHLAFVQTSKEHVAMFLHKENNFSLQFTKGSRASCRNPWVQKTKKK